jgi:hypothetical protein
MSVSEVEKFKKQAEMCRKEAEKATGPADREAWMKLADDWSALALEKERRQRRA